MHYLSAYTLMNKFLLCSEKLLQIDCIYHLFKNNYSLTCVCVFFVVPLQKFYVRMSKLYTV